MAELEPRATVVVIEEAVSDDALSVSDVTVSVDETPADS